MQDRVQTSKILFITVILPILALNRNRTAAYRIQPYPIISNRIRPYSTVSDRLLAILMHISII
jgi:hypothetical protein